MRRHEIGREICQALPVGECADDTTLDAWRLVEHVLDLFRLDATSEYHHLSVLAPQKCDVAVRHTTTEVTAAVYPRPVGRRHEIGLLGRIAEIAARDAFAVDADFAGLAVGDLIESVIENFHADTFDSPADGICAVIERLGVVDAIICRADCRLARAVSVVDDKIAVF